MAKQMKKQVVPTKAPVAKPKAITKAKVISLLVKDNPKRGTSRDRFALYRNGMTVEKYVAASVAAGNSPSLARADLRWDTTRNFIAIR
jgi:hypothetical protein